MRNYYPDMELTKKGRFCARLIARPIRSTIAIARHDLWVDGRGYVVLEMWGGGGLIYRGDGGDPGDED